MTAPDPTTCRAHPAKPSALWWMSADQYDVDACECNLPEGHTGEHRCEHGYFDRRIAVTR